MSRERSVMLMLVWFVALQCIVKTAGDVQYDGDGYVGLVVAFEPGIASESRYRTILNTQEILARTSKVLYKAIGLRLKSAVFLFPLQWDLTRILQDKPIGIPKASENSSSADMLIVAVDSNKKSVFGNGPYTLQNSGCGAKGLRVMIPMGFLIPVITDQKAKALAKEWMKYRYGVFSEGGFPNDPVYPLYYSTPGDSETNVHVTDCANVKVTYKTTSNLDGGSCELEIDKETGRPANSSDCKVVPDQFANSGVTSSIMSSHFSLPSVEHICGDEGHIHNMRSPNKQNVLCRGQSIWEVLKRHEDFKQMHGPGPDESMVEPPVFHYVQERRQRIVLAMDGSSKLAHLQNILYNGVADLVYSLPAGTEFAYAVFGREVQVLGATQTDLQDIPHDLKDRNNMVLQMRPKFSDSIDACVECALSKTIKLLSLNGIQPISGDIVLMTASNPSNIESLVQLELSQLCLTLIIFPGATTEAFSEILNKAQCSKVLSVPKEPTIETMRKIFEALNSVVKTQLSVGQKEIMLKLAELNADKPISFTIDESIKNFTVWISDTSIDIQHIGNLIKISADGPFEAGQEITTVFNFIARSYRSFQASHWTCRLRPSAENRDINTPSPSVLVKIMAFEKETGFLNIRAWHESVIEKKDILADSEVAVKLYASIFQGNHPVINANVVAEIKPPDGRERIRLKLFDNGLGDPDITQYDGIYSAYFVKLKTGEEYEVSVLLDDNEGNASIATSALDGERECCGSELVTDVTSPVGPFSREVVFRFKVTERVSDAAFGPSNINDLRVVSVTRPYRFVLQWTAPGGEKDFGKAARYQLVLFKTRQEALLGTGSGIDGFTLSNEVSPADYGVPQTVIATLSPQRLTPNKFYYFVLKAFNGKGKASTSNAVEVFLSQIIDTTTPDVGNLRSTPNSNSLDGLSKSTVHIIIGVCLSAVVLIVAICIAFYFYVKRKERKKKHSATAETLVKTTRNAGGNDQNNRNDGSVVAREWHLEREPINPLNSVPAAVLMKHHEQVQEAKRRKRDPPLFTLERFQEPKTPQSTEGTIALASSPKLPRQPPVSSESSESPGDSAKDDDTRPTRPRSYKEFKRQITSV